MACWRGVCKLCRSNRRLDDDAAKPKPTLREQLILSTNPGRIREYYSLQPEKLGAGAFGTVCKAVCKSTELTHAVKTVLKNRVESISVLQREIEVTKAMDHPNIVKLVETFEDQRCVYLVMELCTGGELFDQIVQATHFTERQAARLAQQMLRAVSYMHGAGVCHRDLKPENFLLSSEDSLENALLKLVDFGLARRFETGETMKSAAGTLAYVAPEVLSQSYGPACDLWSIGVIIYVLLSGYLPFDGKSDSQTVKRVKKGQYSFDGKAWEDVSDDAKDLIRQLLVLDPTVRLTAAQALEHRWVNELAPSAASSWFFGGRGLDVIDNLRFFHSESRFKQVALTVIAGQLDGQQIQVLRDAFIAMDQDNDGTLSVDEVRVGLAEMKVEIPDDLQQIMEVIDSSGTGRIRYSEFLAAALDARTFTSEEVCWHAFKFFDRDNNGVISQAELSLLLEREELQQLPGSKAASSMLHEIDTNRDGMVEFDEFLKMMASADARATASKSM